MSTFTLPPLPRPSLPVGFSCYPCWRCQCAVLVPEDASDTPECSTCKRANAESVAVQAVSDVQDLIRGRGVFAILTTEERREQLRQCGLDVEPDRNDADRPTAEERDEIESRIELEPDESPEYADDFMGGTY